MPSYCAASVGSAALSSAGGATSNQSSTAAWMGISGFYGLAKASLNFLTTSLAHELAHFNIRVNAIAPGWIPVERHENDPEEEKQAYLDVIPMQRWGVPSDVGGAAVFLASDASSYMTGADLLVDGGYNAW